MYPAVWDWLQGLRGSQKPWPLAGADLNRGARIQASDLGFWESTVGD